VPGARIVGRPVDEVAGPEQGPALPGAKNAKREVATNVEGASVQEIQADVALPAQAELGEGPVWDERRQELLFVDITGRRVHIFRPDGGLHRSFEVGAPVGAVVLRDDGGLLLAAHDTFLVAGPDGAPQARFGAFRADGELVRFNDGKVDPAGRFVAGTMHWGASDPVGSLYMLSSDGSVVTLLRDVTISNGLAWSRDGSTFYYIDTPRHTVDAFDVDAGTGALSCRRVVAEVREGSPDGMAIDDEGMLWVAVWGGYRVERIDPASGRRLATVSLPTRFVSSVAFGGRSLGDLYITTARSGLDEEALAAEPHAGDLFVAHPGVTGPAPYRFKP
jgi:sugar lactone lactonase YvrE